MMAWRGKYRELSLKIKRLKFLIFNNSNQVTLIMIITLESKELKINTKLPMNKFVKTLNKLKLMSSWRRKLTQRYLKAKGMMLH